MSGKTLGRLFADVTKAYTEECKTSSKWKDEAHHWHERALQAEFINALTPWLFLAVIVAIVLVVLAGSNF